MKKILHILFVCFFVVGLASAATEFKSGGALDWYGYQSLISTDAYTNDTQDDDDDDVFRKRRHRRRRKIRPPRKGW